MSQPLIGAPRNRVDGPSKVTGTAQYTADLQPSALAHAVVVTSTIAHGRITSIDDARARALPGIIGVMTHHNAPRVNAGKVGPYDSLQFLLQDDRVQFDRQPVAVVIAETLEAATHGAELVRVGYDVQRPTTDLHAGERFVPKEIFGESAAYRRVASHPRCDNTIRIEQTYRTPSAHHHPMETHATIARWEGTHLTIHDATQWVFGVQRRMASIFGMEPERIRVVAPFVGGAFGSKGQPWSHIALCAMAARLVHRTVKLVVTRSQMFGWVGHRPQTEQRVALVADRDGRLHDVRHDVVSETSIADEFTEPCGVFGRDLYATPNFSMSHELRRLHISKPTYQRGPGESTGSFAIESAMDELAYKLGIDPLELRLRNYSENHPESGKPYTSKALRECYRLASERFGWERRNPTTRSMRNGRMLVGMGVATASRTTFRSEASIRMHMHPDGSVLIQSGTVEQGTGSATVFSQLAAEILEIPYDRVRFEFGSTDLPYAPIAAGSQTAASIGSVVVIAAQQLRERLRTLGGTVPPEGIERAIHDTPSAEEEANPNQAFGAHCAEVEVDPDLGMLRVTRFVGAFDCGRVLNAKTARSQLIGGIVWGISMALFECTHYDARTARIVNADLARYVIPTHADIPEIETIMVEHDDARVNPAHVKGIGEISIAGAAAAVANAVYHATGIRVRDLPITPERLVTLTCCANERVPVPTAP